MHKKEVKIILEHKTISPTTSKVTELFMFKTFHVATETIFNQNVKHNLFLIRQSLLEFDLLFCLQLLFDL